VGARAAVRLRAGDDADGRRGAGRRAAAAAAAAAFHRRSAPELRPPSSRQALRPRPDPAEVSARRLLLYSPSRARGIPSGDCIAQDSEFRAPPCLDLERLESAAGADQKGDAAGGGGGNNDSLLRALRLSQSRAREAEEKLAAAGASNGELAALLVRDSVALSAHRRWVMMLEAENSLLRGGGARPRGAEPDPDDDGDARRGGGGVAAWWVALAVCVGIAGVGLALGRLLC
jgi:hypothetical protein